MELDSRTKESIPGGGSVTANFQPCLERHAKTVLENGADGPEISEAVEVGQTVRPDAASKIDKFAFSPTQDVQSPASALNGRCGCVA